jgi:hypothetical protein
MVQKILNENEESKVLKELPKYYEIFQPEEQEIEDLTNKYQLDMKVKAKEKNNTIIYCEQVLQEAELKAEKESIVLLEKFQSRKKH